MSILGNWLRRDISEGHSNGGSAWTEVHTEWMCSECGRVQKQISNFCPYCGANMIFADREPTVEGIIRNPNTSTSCCDFNNGP